MRTNSHKIELDRIEGDKAVLYFEEGVELVLPAKTLPKGSKEGDTLIMMLATEKAETERKEKTAKEILNEILKTN